MNEQELKRAYARFCQAMLAQIDLHESGETTESWFNYQVGLCTNLANYDYRLSHYQGNLFFKSFQCRAAPFNNNDPAEYKVEHDTYTIYKNPKRLQWLREHSKD